MKQAVFPAMISVLAATGAATAGRIDPDLPFPVAGELITETRRAYAGIASAHYSLIGCSANFRVYL